MCDRSTCFSVGGWWPFVLDNYDSVNADHYVLSNIIFYPIWIGCGIGHYV